MDETGSRSGDPDAGRRRAEKFERLEALLAPLRKVVLAFSGGVDSTFLLAVLRKDPAREVIAVTALSATHPRREREEARELARFLSAEHHEIEGDEIRLEAFRSNPPDRCYHCKKHLFSRIEEIRRQKGYEAVLDGSNADDPADFRPGLRALKELGVRSPLQEARLGKAEIRALSREMGLRTWDKPSIACLASRVPYGTEITEEALLRIDRCEAFLGDRVQGPIRVRAHGDLARIESSPEAFQKMLARREELVRFFKEQGFTYVTLDMQGYRTGSMNESLGKAEQGRH
jgi:uncharacterized protein